jgi:hypothetical protein
MGGWIFPAASSPDFDPAVTSRKNNSRVLIDLVLCSFLKAKTYPEWWRDTVWSLYSAMRQLESDAYS